MSFNPRKRPKFGGDPPSNDDELQLDIGDLFSTLLGGDKQSNGPSGAGIGGLLGDDPVRVVGNHIYFYSEVNSQSCLQLILALKRLDLQIQKQKLETDSDAHIDLHIHSGGGELYSCFAVIDTIRTITTPVYSYIEGMAASAATIISVVCDKRFIFKYSYMLIHQLSGGMWGKFEEMKEDMEACENLMDDIKEIYVEHTKMKKKDLKKFLKHDIWWRSSRCLELGLVDEVL